MVERLPHMDVPRCMGRVEIEHIEMVVPISPKN